VKTGKWAWSEAIPMPPWPCLGCANLWADARYDQLRALLVSPIADPVLETSADGAVTIRTGSGGAAKEGQDFSIQDSGTMVLIDLAPTESGRTAPIPKSVSALPFSVVLMDVPQGQSDEIHPFLYAQMRKQVPIVLLGLQVDVKDQMNQILISQVAQGWDIWDFSVYGPHMPKTKGYTTGSMACAIMTCRDLGKEVCLGRLRGANV
jgi:hypothetical protein